MLPRGAAMSMKCCIATSSRPRRKRAEGAPETHGRIHACRLSTDDRGFHVPDEIYGGTGNDLIEDDPGNDVILGEEGDDVLKGGTGDDDTH